MNQNEVLITHHFKIAVSEDIPPAYRQEAINAARWHNDIVDLNSGTTAFNESEIESIKKTLQEAIDKCDPRFSQYLYIDSSVFAADVADPNEV